MRKYYGDDEGYFDEEADVFEEGQQDLLKAASKQDLKNALLFLIGLHDGINLNNS